MEITEENITEERSAMLSRLGLDVQNKGTMGPPLRPHSKHQNLPLPLTAR